MSPDIEIENFRFFVLPDNTSGSVSKPIARSPALTTLARLCLDSGRNFDAVLLTATVGWQAVTDATGQEKVDVLFKIWRGAPGTGALIFSVVDSGESGFDSNKVPSFTHVDTSCDCRPLTQLRDPLTAELPDAGSAATVVGPITFVATELDK